MDRHQTLKRLNSCLAACKERASMKSTSRPVPHKRFSPANPSWLGKFDEIRSSLEILAVFGKPFFDNFFILR